VWGWGSSEPLEIRGLVSVTGVLIPQGGVSIVSRIVVRAIMGVVAIGVGIVGFILLCVVWSRLSGPRSASSQVRRTERDAKSWERRARRYDKRGESDNANAMRGQAAFIRERTAGAVAGQVGP
jgi:hypothetical protein